MRRFSVFLLALPLIFFTIGTASALTLQDVEAVWSDAVGGTNVVYNPTAPTTANTATVRWGVPAGGGTEQSGLGFTGSVPPGTLEFDPGEIFNVGELSHFNNVIATGSASSAVDLTIDLDFAAGTGQFTFTFLVDETPNGPGPPDSDDIITFPESIPSETIDLGGTEYILQLLGFSDTVPETIADLRDSFISPEGGTNSTFLWAQITTPTGVPEPATLLLVGSGLLGLAGIGRKKFFKK